MSKEVITISCGCCGGLTQCPENCSECPGLSATVVSVPPYFNGTATLVQVPACNFNGSNGAAVVGVSCGTDGWVLYISDSRDAENSIIMEAGPPYAPCPPTGEFFLPDQGSGVSYTVTIDLL